MSKTKTNGDKPLLPFHIIEAADGNVEAINKVLKLRGLYNHVINKTTNLQPMQIHKYYSDKVKSGLNPNTVLKHHALIRSTLQYAKKMGLIKDNAADLIDKTKKKKFIGNFLNKDGIHQVTERCRLTKTLIIIS